LCGCPDPIDVSRRRREHLGRASSSMDSSMLARGIVLGFSIAAAFGPIGLLCVRRTLTGGFAVGFVSGLGAATADALYGAVAAFGLTAVSAALAGNQAWLRLVGGAFLLYLGLGTLWARPPERVATANGRGLAGSYASTLALTLANPMTILSFVAVFASLGLGSMVRGAAGAVFLVLGVFSGSVAWWFILAGAVACLRARLAPRVFHWVNITSGLVIAAFGAHAVATALAGSVNPVG
jgi:threonine/homoserine/homoserine lactone efflux protein